MEYFYIQMDNDHVRNYTNKNAYKNNKINSQN